MLYAKWMNLYEAFMLANDDYCFLVSEDGRKEHFAKWVKDRDVFTSTVKSSVEDYFLGKADEHSVISKQSKFQNKKSWVRLAEESEQLKELEKMDNLLKERRVMELNVKWSFSMQERETRFVKKLQSHKAEVSSFRKWKKTMKLIGRTSLVKKKLMALIRKNCLKIRRMMMIIVKVCFLHKHTTLK